MLRPKIFSGTFPVRSAIIVVVLLQFAVLSQPVIAQSAAVPGVQTRVGLDGVVRLGHWAPVRLTVNDPAVFGRAKSLEITCPDDADVPVTWRSAIRSGSGSDGRPDNNVIEGLFRLGRPNGSLDIRLSDDAGETVFAQSISLADTSFVRVVDGTSPIVLLVGQSDAFRERFPANPVSDNLVVAHIGNPADIPTTQLGLQSASRMVVGGRNGLMPRGIQSDAIIEWVRQGGHLLYMSDPEGDQPDERFTESLVPGVLQENTLLRTSSRLEFFARAREPLAIRPDNPLPVRHLAPAADAEVVVQERELPLIVRRATGFGIVTWTAFAHDSEMFLGWQGTTKSLEQLIVRPFDDERSDARDSMANATTRHGFVDFAGQLRMALENFQSVRLVNFTSVAALSVFAILLFGVGDWFLLRFVFPSRTWTWCTFPLMVLGICLTCWSIQNWARPGEFRLNRLEIVDIDPQSGMYRGSVWNCLFVPASTAADLKMHTTASWLGQPAIQATGWQGQPGSGLGGMQTQTGISIGGGNYSIVNETVDGNLHSETRSIDLAPSSARTFRSQYIGKIAPSTAGRLAINRRLGRLEGVVVNTTPERLIRARVYFGEFVYMLQRNLEPGEAVQITEMVERTSRSVLNRREIISERDRKDVTISTPWLVTDTDLSRIANMIMFHSLAGGSSYSGLTNDYYDQLELSSLTGMNRAVLVGEIDDPLSVLNVDAGGGSGNATGDKFEMTDKSVTIVRLVLPVVADSTAAK